jgi:hypothetical protein
MGFWEKTASAIRKMPIQTASVLKQELPPVLA